MGFRLVKDSEREGFDLMAVHPLQTWEWGDFRKESGNGVIRFVNAHKKTVIDSYQLLIHNLPYSSYKIGTLIKCPKPTKELFPFIKKIARENKLIFIKLEPNVVIYSNTSTGKTSTSNRVSKPPSNSKSPTANQLISLLKNNGCVRGKTLFTPTSFWIDLTRPEEDLLKSFSPKTRYNIRLSEKHGVKITEDNSQKAFDKYLKLTFETAKRQGFYAHTEKYHKLMWKSLYKSPTTNHKSPIARLITATYNNEIITTWILFVWRNFLYYPYGASSDKYKNVMANNLMMWEAIKFGKKMGLKTFDLWGREEGKGFTKFKEGYNPQVVEFLGSWDLVTNKPLYYLYRVIDKLRWKLLKFPSKIKLRLKL